MKPEFGLSIRATETVRVVENLDMTERVLTRQPRKKNNRRWTKKYWKRYSVERPRRDILHAKTNNVWMLICHPSVAQDVRDALRAAREKVEREAFMGERLNQPWPAKDMAGSQMGMNKMGWWFGLKGMVG